MPRISSEARPATPGHGPGWVRGVAIVARLTVLVCGLAFLFFLATSTWVEDRLAIIIAWALKRFTRLESYDFLSVLHLSEGYSVAEISVHAQSWLAGKSLAVGIRTYHFAPGIN